MPGVTGLILCGGQGRRMGGVDKGLQTLRGRPLAAWVLERFRPQVDDLLISTSNAEYVRFGHPVVADRFHEPGGGTAGPLAGLLAGLELCSKPLLASVPCDAPDLPEDLVERVVAALEKARADAAVVRVGTRLHPTFAVLRRELAPRLASFLNEGGRALLQWYGSMHSVEVAFDDRPAAFANVNTADALRELEERR